MRAALPALVALAIVAAGSPCRAQNANPLPPGDGRDLVAVACSQCHYLGTIAKIRDGAAGWRIYVDNMVLRGAQLSEPEVETVVNYLASNLGPGMKSSAGQASHAAGGSRQGFGRDAVQRLP